LVKKKKKKFFFRLFLYSKIIIFVIDIIFLYLLNFIFYIIVSEDINKDDWYLFNDFLVQQISQEEVLSYRKWKVNCYFIFFYFFFFFLNLINNIMFLFN